MGGDEETVSLRDAAEWLRVARQSLAKGQLAHAARLTANSTVFRLWALVGVQAHAATMRALHRLARARPPSGDELKLVQEHRLAHG